MKSRKPAERELLLIGGGHAHCVALRRLAMRPVPGLRVTLINPDDYSAYSGMLPGLIAGHYRFEQIHIDLRRFCRSIGVRFVRDRAGRIELAQRAVVLEDRPPLTYDWLSIDVGGSPSLAVPGVSEYAIPVKPLQAFWPRWQALSQRLRAMDTGVSARLSVVGGGAGSVEIALAVAQALRDRAVDITLLAGGELLPGYLPATRDRVAKALRQLGVRLITGQPVVAVQANAVQLTDGQHIDSDATLWCTGVAPTGWLAESGLPLAPDGFVAVDDSLQLPGWPGVFAAGDCATLLTQPRAKAGVYAVRQGPVLADNWRHLAQGRPASERYQAQRDFLSILSLGERRAVAQRASWSLSGRWVWWWKDDIDRRFMARFTVKPGQMLAPEGPVAPSKPVCGGCGGKLGVATLSEVLQQLAKQYPNTAPVPEACDDASPVELPAHARVWQSIDSLRGLVDDPWLMGRIAALHALSDLFAMGARVHSALTNVVLPYAAPQLQRSDLQQLMAGMLLELDRHGCRLLGGHSQEGAELLVGLSVNGYLLQGERPLRKRGARVGDQLILCKPLGTGVLFAAAMQGCVDGRLLAAAEREMLRSNAEAARIARQFDVSAATDITGFGLLGHVLEMLGDELSAVLDPGALPAMEGAAELLAAGIESSMAAHNRARLSELKDASAGAYPAAIPLLVDPQTSGGLLLAVAPARVDALLIALRAAGYLSAAKVGRLCGRSDSAVTLGEVA